MVKCPGVDKCYKISIVMDKDILDEQKAHAIKNICAKCDSNDKHI